MEGIGGGAVADNLRDRQSAALQRVLQFLNDENSCTFAHHKSVPVPVKRSRGAKWFIIEAARQGARGGEATEADKIDAGLRAAADGDIGLFGPDDPRAVPNRLNAF